jgi:HSP20 family protein
MALYSVADPATGLLALQRELERAFERPMFEFGFWGRGVFPPINAFRDKDTLVLHVEVPGVDASKLNIGSEGRTLIISGTREESVPDGASFHRRERESGQFSRSVQLPEDVDLEHAQASYKNGILTIRISKREKAKPRQITVQVS